MTAFYRYLLLCERDPLTLSDALPMKKVHIVCSYVSSMLYGVHQVCVELMPNPHQIGAHRTIHIRFFANWCDLKWCVVYSYQNDSSYQFAPNLRQVLHGFNGVWCMMCGVDRAQARRTPDVRHINMAST